MMRPPAQAGRISLPADLHFSGTGLARPECVLCTRDGSRYVADWRGGVTHLLPDGSQQSYLAQGGLARPRPNGIALLPDGAFLLADLGELGGVWRLERSGALTPFLTEIEGHRLPPCNFVTLDAEGRVWITVSTRHEPRQRAQRPDVADGFIVLVTDRGARIVADGLGYTNELVVDGTNGWLYVNETCARRLSRFRLGNHGQLGRRELVQQFGPGDFPDGLALDEAGGLWVVSIVSNRVYRLSTDRELSLVLEDSEATHLDWVEGAFQNGHMSAEHFATTTSQTLRNISSIAFGGEDRRTAWLGSLLGGSLAGFRAPVAGAEPVHWNWCDTGSPS